MKIRSRRWESRNVNRSVVVSYKCIDRSLVTSRTGYGRTYDDAIRDADSQMPDGVWERIVVSNVNSIVTDLKNAGIKPFGRITLHRGEGVVIRVEKRISEVIDVD